MAACVGWAGGAAGQSRATPLMPSGHGHRSEPTAGSVLAWLKSSLQDSSFSSHGFFQPRRRCPSRLRCLGAQLELGACPRKLLSPVAAQAAAGTGMDLSLLRQGREAPAGMARARMGPSSRLSSSSSTGPKSATGNCFLWRLLMLQIFPCSVLAPAEAPDNAKAAVSQFFCNIYLCVQPSWLLSC